ncbi:acylphosphatase [Mobilicoccus pelagius]|uniref:acylphosphatase n=1 Tax=Mobilicoccus pelagius NBRC 104925 TaxID=1089455 RepID=H5UNE0_9MICO|nr:acylphosphatase [Mobilicoccus pelagius]GAB47248.1 acylphosphatase [Mobilicoccus pelagius NBRC 104925]
MSTHESTDEQARATIFVSGRVQGVGFRWWTRSRALELGLVGRARNLDDGRVEIVAQGPRGDVERLEELVRELPGGTGRPGRVTSCTTQWSEPRDGVTGFHEA